jgi:AraC-like DNA-binding protein
MENIVDTLIWAAIMQGLLLGFLYIFSRKFKSPSNKLLGFFLLAFVLEALTNVSLERIGTYSINGYFTLPEVKLLLPVLFLNYVLEKLGRTSAYRFFLKVHYLLAFGFLSITFLNIFLFLLSGKDIYQTFEFYRIEAVFMIMQYYAFFLTIAALAISFREITAYKELIKSTYSDMGLLQIRWLWQFILGLVPVVLLWGLELIRIAMGGRGLSAFSSLTWIFIIAYIYFISFKAYQRKDLLEDVPQPPGEDINPIAPSGKSPRQDDPELARELTSFMESSKIYLRQDLTLYDLSRAFDASPRAISTCINQHFRNNFTEWVNNFRVNTTRARLKDPSYRHLSIEGIGMESGFKSRSAMYAAFKKQTGHSPGFFRKE